MTHDSLFRSIQLTPEQLEALSASAGAVHIQEESIDFGSDDECEWDEPTTEWPILEEDEPEDNLDDVSWAATAVAMLAAGLISLASAASKPKIKSKKLPSSKEQSGKEE